SLLFVALKFPIPLIVITYSFFIDFSAKIWKKSVKIPTTSSVVTSAASAIPANGINLKFAQIFASYQSKNLILTYRKNLLV
ncbi:MAG: hypothetical protein ACKO96_37310, partial [Flammeovirgaceae bacterium]